MDFIPIVSVIFTSFHIVMYSTLPTILFIHHNLSILHGMHPQYHAIHMPTYIFLVHIQLLYWTDTSMTYEISRSSFYYRIKIWRWWSIQRHRGAAVIDLMGVNWSFLSRKSSFTPTTKDAMAWYKWYDIKWDSRKKSAVESIVYGGYCTVICGIYGTTTTMMMMHACKTNNTVRW